MYRLINIITWFLSKGVLTFILFGLLAYLILEKEVNIGFSLSAPTASAQLIDVIPPKKTLAPENKEPSILSSLFPKSRAVFKDDLSTISEQKQLKYINRFGHVAVKEMKKYGIPASIILANGLLHSQAGQAHISRKDANNHFGIPCSDDWNNESSEYKGRCFRHYNNAWMSFRDHSIFMTSERFPVNQNLSSKDYKNWAKALEHTKYSPYPRLSEKLLQIIAYYKLTVFDDKL